MPSSSAPMLVAAGFVLIAKRLAKEPASVSVAVPMVSASWVVRLSMLASATLITSILGRSSSKLIAPLMSIVSESVAESLSPSVIVAVAVKATLPAARPRLALSLTPSRSSGR